MEGQRHPAQLHHLHSRYSYNVWHLERLVDRHRILLPHILGIVTDR